jgi:hypothetical protein
MTEVVTATGASTSATIEQLFVPSAMISATEPYRRANRLVDTFGEDVHALLNEADGFLRIDHRKQLLCLQNAKTDAQRWRLGYRARDELRDLPALADVYAAHQAIRRDLNTEPPIESRVELVGIMLDVQGITADLSYIQFLAWKLGDCPRRKTEIRMRTKPWFSLVTITRTIDEVLMTLNPEQGRPISPTDVLDIAGRNASEVIRLAQSTFGIGKAISRLQQIAEATKDAKPPARSESAAAADDDDMMDIPF